MTGGEHRAVGRERIRASKDGLKSLRYSDGREIDMKGGENAQVPNYNCRSMLVHMYDSASITLDRLKIVLQIGTQYLIS